MKGVPHRLPRVTEMAHLLIERIVREGDCVLDATVGNGHDTVFLSDLVGPRGKVYGFDLQQSAIDSTRHRLGDRRNVKLIHAGHEELPCHVAVEIRAAMFNLGYLPGGDKNVKTLPATTLRALDLVFERLCAPGLISLVVYPGHSGGRDEATAVEQWVKRLDPKKTSCARWSFNDAESDFPYLVAIEKL